MECRGLLLITQFADRKGLGTCDALECVPSTLQSALVIGQEAIEWFKSTSVPLLTGMTVSVFSSCSALWELEVLCYQF